MDICIFAILNIEYRIFRWARMSIPPFRMLCREGFDHRVSNLNGVLGAGIYFSECSDLSHLYSALGPHSACPQALTTPPTLRFVSTR